MEVKTLGPGTVTPGKPALALVDALLNDPAMTVVRFGSRDKTFAPSMRPKYIADPGPTVESIEPLPLPSASVVPP